MNFSKWIVAATSVCVMGFVGSARANEATCVSTFSVKATMDSFVGKVTSEPFDMPGDGGELTVRVRVDKMDTGKKKRDAEMRHMFKSEEFPEIVGTVSAKDLEAARSASGEGVSLPIRLTMHGVTQDIDATLSRATDDADGDSFKVNFTVSLKAFGLKPPSIMGLIKVNDTVKVESVFGMDAASAE